MGTIPKNIKLAFKPIGTDAITRTRIKQFWSENGESNTQRLTDAAQKVIYDAWEAGSVEEMIQLAKKALTLSPFCMDAYNILAERGSNSHI